MRRHQKSELFLVYRRVRASMGPRWLHRAQTCLAFDGEDCYPIVKERGRAYKNRIPPSFSSASIHGTPSYKQKRLWCREARHRAQQAIRQCQDFDELIVLPAKLYTNLYDWY